MKKPLISLSVIASTLSLAMASIITKAIMRNTLQSGLSLGKTLNLEQSTQTQRTLGADNADRVIIVDGKIINNYLNDGSNINTPVYSSAYIEQREPGFGVQVQILTPQNILVVKPPTYQNAAITSGAKDVLIRVASPVPVTGEGGTGVYALLKEIGVPITQQDIDIAEKEVTLINNVKDSNELTESLTNQLITDIKREVIKELAQQADTPNKIDIEKLVVNIINHYDIDVNQNTINQLTEIANNFSTTEASKNEDTIKQLDKSVKIDKNRPYAVDLQQYGDLIQFGNVMKGDPSTLTIDLIQKTLTTEYDDSSKNSYDENLTIESIDTKTIPVYDVITNKHRDVHVNTQLTVGGDTVLYTFVNRDGYLALARLGEGDVYEEFIVLSSEVNKVSSNESDKDGNKTTKNTKEDNNVVKKDNTEFPPPEMVEEVVAEEVAYEEETVDSTDEEEPTEAEVVTESIEDEEDYNPSQEELSIDPEEGVDKSTELEAKENMGNEPVEIEHEKPFNEDCSLDGEYQLSHKLLEISTKMVVKGDKVLFDSEIE